MYGLKCFTAHTMANNTGPQKKIFFCAMNATMFPMYFFSLKSNP